MSHQRVHKRPDARRRLADVLGIRQETATKQMGACGRALRVAAGPPLAVLCPLTMGPPWPAGHALPETGLRPLIRRYKVEGALEVF